MANKIQHLDIQEFDSGPLDWPYALTPQATAVALRRFADQLEAGEVLLVAIKLTHEATSRDFQNSTLSITHMRKRVPTEGQ